jgi:hypothetical protein
VIAKYYHPFQINWISGSNTTGQGDLVKDINYSLYNDVIVRMDTAIVEGDLDVNATMGFKNSTS